MRRAVRARRIEVTGRLSRDADDRGCGRGRVHLGPDGAGPPIPATRTVTSGTRVGAAGRVLGGRGDRFARAGRSPAHALELALQSDVLLQAAHIAHHRIGDERDHHSGRAGPAGTTGTVEVRLGVLGEVEVHDTRDTVDVDAASRDVGGDECVDLTLLERLQRTIALVL